MKADDENGPLAQESRFNGSARWMYTVVAIGSIFVVFGLAHRRPSFALFMALIGGIGCVIAVIDWRNWLKKSEAEKAPLRFLPQLEIKDISIPLRREEFDQARRAAHLNLSIAAIALLCTFCSILYFLSLFNPHIHKFGLQLGVIALVTPAAWILWHCGKRFLRAAKMLTCPGCKDLLTSQAESVLETGRCRKCGYAVLVD